MAESTFGRKFHVGKSDSGTTNAAVTVTDKSLTDTRESWTVGEWVGCVVTCDGKTMKVTSNTATTLGGSGWVGSTPATGQSWTLEVNDAPSTGESNSQDMQPGYGPVNVLLPANLQGVDRLKFQVSDSEPDANFYDVMGEDGALDYLTLAGTDRVLDIPAVVRRGCLGWGYVRLVTLDGSSAAEAPAAAIEFMVRFAQVHG